MYMLENTNYNNLNNMIKYIEDNLINEIDMNELAKIVGISINSLQRIFTFMTGLTITEYIKKRRLSKAFEEIKTTNIKIVDVALKYQYNYTITFDRAFKKEFGMTPIECRERDITYKQFPIVVFKNNENYQILNYKIEYLKETQIYYYKTETNKRIDLLYKIRELYNCLKENGIHEKLKEEEQYAISSYNKGNYYYMVGSKTKYTSNRKIKISSGKYVVFEVGSREQKDIVNLKENIYSKWAKSTNIDIDKNFSLEYYKDDNCYICLPITNQIKP